MALLTSKPISALAVALLQRQLVLGATVLRVNGAEYAGGSGGVVSVRVPVARTANTQSTPGATITSSAISETSVDVTVSHLYDAGILTDEDLSLKLQDFGV